MKGLSILCVIITMYEQPGLKCYSLGDNLLRRLVESVMCVESIGLSAASQGMLPKK